MYRNYTQPLSVNTMEITAISLLSNLTHELTYVALRVELKSTTGQWDFKLHVIPQFQNFISIMVLDVREC